MKTIYATPAETLLQRLLLSEKLRTNYTVLVQTTADHTHIVVQVELAEKAGFESGGRLS